MTNYAQGLLGVAFFAFYMYLGCRFLMWAAATDPPRAPRWWDCTAHYLVFCATIATVCFAWIGTCYLIVTEILP